MDREWERMSTNAKDKINSAIDEATTFLKSLVNEARRKLRLNGVQTRKLMICAGESFGFAERALVAVLDLLKDAFKKLRDGIIKPIEAVKSFAGGVVWSLLEMLSLPSGNSSPQVTLGVLL